MMSLTPVGRVESSLTDKADAPRQGDEGAPDAWVVFAPEYADALRDLKTGDDILFDHLVRPR